MADESKTVEQVFESTLESVDHAEHAALDMAREAGFEEADLDRIGMSVRECMVNAVVHGNRYNSHKKVQFSVSRTPEYFTIKIADQGAGFNPGELPDPVEGENLFRHSGRGIFLMKTFMDELHIRHLQPGTEVTLIKKVVSKQ